MANRKITDLDQINDIATGDLLLINDISEATDLQSKNISIQQLDTRYQEFNPTATPLGEMYQIDNVTETTISVTDTYVQVTNFVEGETNLVTFNSNTLVPSNDGDYQLVVSLDATGDSVSAKEFEFVIRVNGVAVDKTKRERSLTSSSTGAMPLSGILVLEADDIVDLAVKNTSDTTNLTIINCNMSIHGI